MAHQGGGKFRDTTNYIYANDVVEVLARFRRIPAVKRSRSIPTIEPLSAEESAALEKIIAENNVNLERARATWYFGLRLR